MTEQEIAESGARTNARIARVLELLREEQAERRRMDPTHPTTDLDCGHIQATMRLASDLMDPEAASAWYERDSEEALRDAIVAAAAPGPAPSVQADPVRDAMARIVAAAVGAGWDETENVEVFLENLLSTVGLANRCAGAVEGRPLGERLSYAKAVLLAAGQALPAASVAEAATRLQACEQAGRDVVRQAAEISALREQLGAEAERFGHYELDLAAVGSELGVPYLDGRLVLPIRELKARAASQAALVQHQARRLEVLEQQVAGVVVTGLRWEDGRWQQG